MRVPYRVLTRILLVDTLAAKYSLYRYIVRKVYTIWVHGPLGTYIGTPVRPKYLLYGYMEPLGKV